MHQEHWTYAFEISVNDPEVMNVCYTRRDLRELSTVDE